MGGLFGGPDTSAQNRAAEQARRAQAEAEARAREQRHASEEAARLAAARQRQTEQLNADRKKRVAAGGRESTLLAGDSGSNTLLGG